MLKASAVLGYAGSEESVGEKPFQTSEAGSDARPSTGTATCRPRPLAADGGAVCVGQRAAAVDEVMQEVALAAVRQQAPLADSAKIAPWLYRLAVTQSPCFAARRGTPPIGHALRRGRGDRHGRRWPTRSNGSLGSRAPLGLRRAIRAASIAQIEILLLKYVENWSYAQLAAHPVESAAVESLLHRARRRLACG